MRTVIVTGAANGLGRALVEALVLEDFYVIGIDKAEIARKDTFQFHARNCDLADPADIQTVCDLYLKPFEVDCLINCAAINLLDYIENITTKAWDKVMAVNVRAPYLLVQALLPKLAESKGTVINIVSNAAHLPMTASLAYNASKGALHIMTLQMARELTKRHGITVFGVAPNKMAGTGMSRYIEDRVSTVRGWTPEYAEQYQKASLVSGEETPPEAVAAFIAYILSTEHKHLSGTVIPYGA